MKLSARLPLLAFGVALAWPAFAAAQREAPTEAQQQAASIVPEYAAVLQTLDPATPESILRARDAARATYAKAVSVEADAVFRQFQAFYDRVLRNRLPIAPRGSPLHTLLNAACPRDRLRCSGRRVDAFLASPKPNDARRREENAAATAELRRYRACGVSFSYGQSDWYAAADPSFLLDMASSLPLGDLGEWVRFWAADEPQRIGDDAALLVSWDDLGRRLVRWEDFARHHPALPEVQDEVIPHIKHLIALYVFGSDSTPAYETRFQDTSGRPPLRINPALKASYERFLVEHRDSSYYRLIGGIVTRLSRSGGVPNQELRDFLAAELRDPYFDHWLRAARNWTRGRP